jgi:hypothetical protein
VRRQTPPQTNPPSIDRLEPLPYGASEYLSGFLAELNDQYETRRWNAPHQSVHEDDDIVNSDSQQCILPVKYITARNRRYR